MCKYKTKLYKANGRKDKYNSVYCLHQSNTFFATKTIHYNLFRSYFLEYSTQINIGGACI